MGLASWMKNSSFINEWYSKIFEENCGSKKLVLENQQS
jgi:hypothetical protein